MILVVGSINMDVILQVRHIPQPGETILASGIRKSPGGKGANQAAAASKLGGDVVLLGCLSDDTHSRILLESLQRANVNIEHIKIIPGINSPSAFICVSESGENCIVVDSGSNAYVSPEFVREKENLFNQAEYCVMQLEIPQETVREVKKLCEKHGVKMILNPSPMKGVPIDIVDHVNILVPNEDEAAYLLGVNCFAEADQDKLQGFLQQHSIETMIVTLGKDGCLLVRRDEKPRHIKTIPRKAVDTTGAGDTFLGAFATMSAEGKSLEESIMMSNIASGLQVMKCGAQEAIPERKVVDYEYKKGLA